MIAEILCVGTELLMGQIVNTNAQFLSRRLSELGVSCYHQTTVGDNDMRLQDAYRTALGRADVIITSGGLGPTVDDITKRAAAKVLNKPLVLRPEAEEMVKARFALICRPMAENNLSQAMFTPDTTILFNPNGTAPGAMVPAGDGKVIFHLPGPPIELEPMFDLHIAPWLQRHSHMCFESRYIRIFGMGESDVDARLNDLEEESNPTLSPYCSLGEVQLRATAAAPTREEALALLMPRVEEVKARLGDVVYSVDPDNKGSLAASAMARLMENGLTAAVAESLTGGMICQALTDIPGASSVLLGGFVTYTEQTKMGVLNVPEEILKTYGAVSGECAKAMAENARRIAGSDIAVSATGFAGPDGGTADAPVGTVFIGLATREGVTVIKLRLAGSRHRIRTISTLHALNALRLAAGAISNIRHS
jgi:nicotinamide-nucleotide amidase